MPDYDTLFDQAWQKNLLMLHDDKVTKDGHDLLEFLQVTDLPSHADITAQAECSGRKVYASRSMHSLFMLDPILSAYDRKTLYIR